VVVLHRDLPGLHGDIICRTITDSGKAVMVLIFTAAGTPADRMTGRGLGADDYLPKPFHFPNSPGARPGSNSTRCSAPSPTTGAADPGLAQRVHLARSKR
jgi:CheY-like chemotaxis protein